MKFANANKNKKSCKCKKNRPNLGGFKGKFKGVVMDKKQDEKEIRGACVYGCKCLGWDYENDCCRSADCVGFIGLNDFSEEAHESYFED